ncbi:MAG: hypothetical protein RLY21_2054 [Planctomycetota bacterium]|jgi:hypothetical protein
MRRTLIAFPGSLLAALLIAFASLCAPAAPASAQFSVPSDGSDGAFNPTSNITIDLGTAKTAPWNTPADYNLQGVYDPEQWFVVYKFTSVNIPAGVTVTFKNHPKNPPVVWLVQGDVTINGTIELVGQLPFSVFAKGGPGGFRGAWHGYGGPYTNHFGWGASVPGNAGCFPLIGGRGGVNGYYGGCGGGGAILVASNTRITGGGTINASGNSYYGPAGGGGMVRLVAPSTALYALYATGGSAGRIRIEANSVQIGVTDPPYSAASLPTNFVFLRDTSTPAIRVVSIGGVAAPTDPTGAFASPTDVVVPSEAVQIVLECKNVPANATVQVELRSATNATYSLLNATFQSGDLGQSTWVATGNLGTGLGYATVMARAVLPSP